MRVQALRIPCKDLAQAERFYARALGRAKAFGDAGQGFVGFALDNVTVLIEQQDPDEFESGRYLGFSLAVDDIDNYYRQGVDDGLPFLHPPERQAWGGTMTHLRDDDGNVFSIVQMDTSG